jgi:hypothetical protein
MKKNSANKFGTCAFLFLIICPALSAAEIQENPLPPAANLKIDFDHDIRPILETSCVRCHGGEKPRSRFRLENRESALNGGDDNTNDIVPGDSSKSLLINYVARQVPDMEMPPTGKGEPLTPRQIGLLRAWIDQGANWNTTNQPAQLAFTFAPTLRWIGVQGDQSKFRELDGMNNGFSGGVEHFSVFQQTTPDEKFSLEGNVLVPDQDVELKLAVDENDRGFVHAGFDEWRKYYDDRGGYDPAVIPPEFSLNRDLYVDNGRIWVDLGLTLPHWPQVVLGYEYDFKKGTESTLEWGAVNSVNGVKNIAPATKAIDEETHIIKLDVTHDFDNWHLEDNARVEFYTESNRSDETNTWLGGAPITQDDYHHVQGMNTLMLEKQIRDWWFLSGGYYYSRLEGSDFFNQTNSPNFEGNDPSSWSSGRITLRRESEIFSVASLFTPLDYLSLSLGTQNEWTHEEGFGASVPDFEVATNAFTSANYDEFKASQNANLRFTKIPFTVLFAEARSEEEGIGEYQQEEDPGALTNKTDATSDRYNLQTGFNTSPWRWFALDAQYQRQYSDTDYNHLIDEFGSLVGDPTFVTPSNGYPAFILNRKIQTDEFETKLTLRPANWLRTTLTYQITATDYSSKTDPAFLGLSPGGPILDGRYDAQTYGFSTTLTPWRRFYLSGTFTYSQSRAVTADNRDASIAPYRGNIYTLTATATYALNSKTDLQANYNFSHAGYGQNNSALGVPLGLDFTRHQLIAGLTRRFSARVSGTLRYEFDQYTEPSSVGANNFTAHGIFATIAYKWQ